MLCVCRRVTYIYIHVCVSWHRLISSIATPYRAVIVWCLHRLTRPTKDHTPCGGGGGGGGDGYMKEKGVGGRTEETRRQRRVFITIIRG